MEKSKNTTWLDHHTDEYWISHRFVRAEDQFEVEVWVKVCHPSGIKHQLRWVQKYDEKRLVQEACTLGPFSARPYRLGQMADFTTANCIDTLFHHFCVARHLDPEALYYDAYQKRKESGADPEVTRQLAEWEGLVYPQQWRDHETRKLLATLSATNQHGLVSSVVKALPHLESQSSPRKKKGGTGEPG